MTIPPWSGARPWLFSTATAVVFLLIVALVAFAPSGRGGEGARTAAGLAGGSAAHLTGLTAAPGAPGADVTLPLTELFRRRAQAVLEGDRGEWLSTLDPRRPAFVQQQAALFDRLRLLPLT